MSLLSMTLNLLMGGSRYLLSLFMIISVNPRGNLFDKFFCLGFYHISVRNQNHTPFNNFFFGAMELDKSPHPHRDFFRKNSKSPVQGPHRGELLKTQSSQYRAHTQGKLLKTQSPQYRADTQDKPFENSKSPVRAPTHRENI